MSARALQQRCTNALSVINRPNRRVITLVLHAQLPHSMFVMYVRGLRDALW